MKQVKEITAVLNKYGINYWIDHGTLLGFVREKNTISWDNDVDLSIKRSDLKKINLCLIELSKKYFIKKKINNKKVVNFSFYPKNRKGLKFDFKIYDKYKNVFVYSSYTQKLDFRKQIPRSKKFKIIIHNIFYTLNPLNFFHVVLRLFLDSKWCPKVVNLEKFPWNSSFKKTHVWRVPQKYLEKFEFIDGIRVPKNPEKYLEYRYGKNWRIPDRDWNYKTDDPTYIKIK